MESNKGLIGAIIAVLVVAGVGFGIYAMSNNDDDMATDTSEIAQNEQSTEPVEETQAPSQNIVELAVATPQLSTLVAAVQEAELVDTLSGEGPFTVLAPTDEAFAAALEALDITAEELLAREDLADILTYHVIAADVMSSDLVDGQTVTTVNGGNLTVDITEEGVFFVDAKDGRAQVVTADVAASNGTVHLIDAVLLP